MDAPPKKGVCVTAATVESTVETTDIWVVKHHRKKNYYAMENRAGGVRDMRRRR